MMCRIFGGTLASIHEYKPKNIPDNLWHQVRPWVVEQAEKYADLHPGIAFRRYAGPLAGIAAYCVDTGYELETSVLLDDEIIEQYVQSLDVSRASKSDRRKTLKRLGETLNDTWEGPRKYNLYPASDPTGPYSDKEQQLIRSWASYASAGIVADERKKIVALGLGAGLTASDMADLRWGHIRFDNQGAVITLPQRVVPMLGDDGEQLHDLRHDTDSSDYVLRPNVSNRHPDAVVTKTLTQPVPGFHRPTVRRMRATWIVTLLHMRIPDWVICSVAGIRQLRKYEAFRPEVDPDEVLGFRHVFAQQPTSLRVVDNGS